MSALVDTPADRCDHELALRAGTSQPRHTAAEEAALSAYLDAALDCVVIADESGCVVEFNKAAERTFGYTREEALGRTLAELIVPPSLRERHGLAFARFVETGEERLFGRRLELTGMRADGSEFPVELALSRVDGEPLLVCGALRDVTAAKQAEEDLRKLADEQAALRRVATFVAQGSEPAEVFAAVAEGVAQILGVPAISMIRFESDGTATKIASWGESRFPVGSRWTLDDPSLMAAVRKTGRPARVDDYATLSGAHAHRVREAGVRSGIGAPIVVDGNNWGVVVAFSTDPEPISADAESRLARFTELVGIAISNTQTRDDLRKSEELYRRTIAQAGAVPYLYDYAEDRYTFIGEGIEELTGFTPAEFTPDAWGGMIEETILRGEQAGFTNDEAVRRTRSGEFTRWGSDQRIKTRDGASRWISDASVEILGRDGRSIGAMGMLQDITERKRTEQEMSRLADEQAALRRVATLIAREARPAEVFSAVAKEVAHALDVPLTAVVRYEPEGMAIQVGAWGGENPFPIGTSWALDDRSVSGLVASTGRPARVNDYSEVAGAISTTLAREAGIRTAVGVPILVDGKTWGVMMALSTEQKELPADTEARLAAFTELIATAISNIQARDDLRDLANEQAALRRVATLVARGTDAPAVFSAVCAETGELIGATSVNLAHFTPDGFNSTMAGWSLRDTHVPTGTRLPLSGDTINGLIQRTAAPARFDSYEDSSSELAAVIRQRGVRSEIGAPVIVEGQLWGALIVGTDRDELLPAGAELRVARFAELVATAVANATTRSELIASRARIVAAGDEARRRLERNLHDATQQRLVALGLDLQGVRATLPADQHEARSNLERIENETDTILEEVRELSRGLHPALLSQSGLGPALSALARNSPIKVDLNASLDKRPPEAIETAVYYVISEALTNAAKHSQATAITVTVAAGSDVLHATIEDDGVGGAEASAGSGLIGLIDRVEALGGRLALDSPPGEGTKIAIELPVDAPPFGELARHVGAALKSGAGLASQTDLLGLPDTTTLLAAIGAVADGLYVVDAQGRIRFLNPAALRILGYEDERQLLGRPSHATIHYLRGDGTPFPAAECPLLRPRLSGETVRVEEDWFVRQDGSLVPVAYSSAPVPLPDGRGAVVSFSERSKVDFR
jgi:PAS domain S-box-containing protein